MYSHFQVNDTYRTTGTVHKTTKSTLWYFYFQESSSDTWKNLLTEVEEELLTNVPHTLLTNVSLSSAATYTILLLYSNRERTVVSFRMALMLMGINGIPLK